MLRQLMAGPLVILRPYTLIVGPCRVGQRSGCWSRQPGKTCISFHSYALHSRTTIQISAQSTHANDGAATSNAGTHHPRTWLRL